MKPEELKESAEHAHLKGEKEIGLTMAVVAVLLAVTTLLSHRSHTEEVLLQGKASDRWNFYQAKHIRAYEFAIAAQQTFLVTNGKDLAVDFFVKSTEEECGVPIEKGCKDPLSKDHPTPILSQLAKEMSANKSKDQKTEDRQTPAMEPVGKPEHAATSGEKHEQPGKPGAPKDGAKKIQEQAFDLEHERDQIQHRANYYDAAELFLEVSIVLCSISLLAEDKLYWKLSFFSTVIGIAVIAAGALLK